jgi:signal transduction histidine kinase
MAVLGLNKEKGNGLGRPLPFFAIYKYSIISICFVAIFLFFVSIPIMFTEIKENCISARCIEVGAVPPGAAGLAEIGWSASGYATFYTGLYTVFGLVFLGAGLLLFLKKQNSIMSLFATLTLCTFGVTFTEVTKVLDGLYLWVDILIRLLDLSGIIGIVLFFFLFPNGKFVPKWSIGIALLLLLPRVFEVLFPSLGWSLNDTPWLIGLWLVLWLGTQLGSQIYRYFSVSSEVERQQTKWVVFGFAVTVIGFLSVGVLPVMLDQSYITEGGPIKFALINLGVYSAFLAMPITITYSILRRRLWDIDFIIKGTFVYGTMFLFIVSVYILVVWYLGYLFQRQGNLLFSLVATAIIALLFAPVKEKLQRTANRLLYGDRESPYKALENLSKQLEWTLEPDQTLEILAKIIKDSMRLPYVSISVNLIGNSEIAASLGQRQTTEYTYHLEYKRDYLGVLTLSPRYVNEVFSTADEKLLKILIRQSAAIVYSLLKDFEVLALNDNLKESRERLVLAREEERRRLRRNLHDDLAPRLAALALNVGTVQEMMEDNPKKATALLGDVREVIRKSVADIRHLVHDLRPPALDELGLINAIHERINDLHPKNAVGTKAIQFHFDSPRSLPVLPAAVEVAAFRILTEALVNVVKHSKATECSISIMINESEQFLELEVVDNGVGINFSTATLKKGIGLYSMSERSQELGGEWRIQPLKNGTKVFARLPITDYKNT